MIRHSLSLAFASLLAMTAAPAAANDVTAQVPVTDDFVIGSSGWTGGVPGKLLLAWKPMAVNGKPMVCGAYAVTDNQLRAPVNNMLRRGAVRVGDNQVLTNLRYFNRTNVRTEDGLVGQTANCALAPGIAGSQQIFMSLGSGNFRN